jgi:hypothetical protein
MYSPVRGILQNFSTEIDSVRKFEIIDASYLPGSMFAGGVVPIRMGLENSRHVFMDMVGYEMTMELGLQHQSWDYNSSGWRWAAREPFRKVREYPDSAYEFLATVELFYEPPPPPGIYGTYFSLVTVTGNVSRFAVVGAFDTAVAQDPGRALILPTAYYRAAGPVYQLRMDWPASQFTGLTVYCHPNPDEPWSVPSADYQADWALFRNWIPVGRNYVQE